MTRRANAKRCQTNLARVGLGVCNELGNRLEADRWVHLQDKRIRDEASNRRNIAQKVEGEVSIECRVDRIAGPHPKQRVPVGWRVDCRLGGDDHAGAWLVLDDDLLTEPL